MIKTFFLSVFSLLGLARFSPVSAQKVKQNNSISRKAEVKFLDNIEVQAAPVGETEKYTQLSEFEAKYFAKKEVPAASSNLSIEGATRLQIKYAILLDTEVEEVKNVALFQGIDEWYGTRYQYGGTTKSGIDCSAFVQTLYATYFGASLPRTAREQYEITNHDISRTELKEGDLVFFNTTGGVSHVGIYLQNNKFVHAASSGGVMISDLFDNYWSRRFIGVGRYEKSQQPQVNPVLLSKL